MRFLTVLILLTFFSSCTMGADVPESFHYNFSDNYRQGYYQCAAYSMFAVIKILSKQHISPDFLVMLTGVDPGKGVLPKKIKQVLDKYNIVTNYFTCVNMPNENKIIYLKNTIIDDGPPIILVRTASGVLHWATVLGYTGDDFYIYDSAMPAAAIIEGEKLQTIDQNGLSPGNITMSKSTLLAWWRSAKRNYSILENSPLPGVEVYTK